MSAPVATRDLVEQLADSGFLVSTHQLKRLRREGLVPRPIQRHRIGVPGSTTWYPGEALDQTKALLRLRNEHGYRTFRELRIAAWLEGMVVDFTLLRPDVVALLRQGLAGQQRLSPSNDDDQLSRRLVAAVDTSGSARRSAFESAVRPLKIEDVLLTVLQLATSSTDSAAAGETFDEAFSYEPQGSVSDSLMDWELPGTPKWPRIVSRVSSRWFPVGRNWVNLVKAIVIESRSPIEELNPSPALNLVLSELRDQLSDPSPRNLVFRNLLACQGIVLGKEQTDLVLTIFESPD